MVRAPNTTGTAKPTSPFTGRTSTMSPNTAAQASRRLRVGASVYRWVRCSQPLTRKKEYTCDQPGWMLTYCTNCVAKPSSRMSVVCVASPTDSARSTRRKSSRPRAA